MRLILLAAVAHDRAIGIHNQLPWHLPEDLKRFKDVTTGHAVAMGRKTFDSIVARLGRPLPNRLNLVLSRSADISVAADQAQLQMVRSLDELRALPIEEIYVIGGAEIYQDTIHHAQELDITEVDIDVPGADAFFPTIDPAVWHPQASEWRISQASGLRYRFVRYHRRL